MKLTNSLRENMKRDIVSSVYSEKIENAKKEICDDLLKHFDARGEIKASNIPDGFEKYIQITSTASVYRQVQNSISINLPESYCLRRHQYTLQAGEYGKEWQPESVKKYLQLETEIEEFKMSVTAVLKSCNTDNQLIEIAPEMAKFLPEKHNNIGFLVPVETINKVRTVLGTQE